MQQIDVRPQTQLSIVRTFGLCMKGIKHRLFRSVLTTMVIILAVAFFMNLLADSIVARAVDTGVKAELAVTRSTAVATDLWFGKPSATVLAGRLAAPSAPIAAYAAIAGWEQSRLADVAAACAREQSILAWLGRLDAGTRAMLVRRTRDEDIFAWLADEAHWSDFAAAAVRVRSDPVPMPLVELRQVVAAAPTTAVGLSQLATDWSVRITAVEADVQALTAVGERDGWVAWLAAANAEQLRAFGSLLTAHGFAALYPDGALDDLQAIFRLDHLRDAVSAALVSDAGRKRWLSAFRTTVGLDEKLLQLDDQRAVTVLDGQFTAEELTRLADAVRHDRALAAREQALAGKVDPDGGLVSTRQALLVAISFLVCMVGIANAMLMAITERFREIATMKCLGATDGFILTQFLMEAGIQGAAGGAMGTVVGLALSLLKGGWLYGGHLIWCFPALHLLVAALACIVAGLLLATLASIYPSWMASRMAPMEAMRVE